MHPLPCSCDQRRSKVFYKTVLERKMYLPSSVFFVASIFFCLCFLMVWSFPFHSCSKHKRRHLSVAIKIRFSLEIPNQNTSNLNRVDSRTLFLSVSSYWIKIFCLNILSGGRKQNNTPITLSLENHPFNSIRWNPCKANLQKQHISPKFPSISCQEQMYLSYSMLVIPR